jgi:hypothetical protein
VGVPVATPRRAGPADERPPLRLVLVFWAASAWAAPGKWGEDPSKVPEFAPAEERRAPKMPDGDDWYRSLAGETQAESLENALLVCYNEVRQKTLWFWSLRNVAMSLTLRKEPPIELWAAWLHDASYVSIPRVRLSRGDRVAVRFIDRGMLGDKPLGSAERRFDGKLPLLFDLPGIYVQCRVMTHEKALQAASGRLRLIDEAMDRYQKAAPPDFHRRDGASLDPDFIRSHLRGDYGKLALRYVAGFLGWEDPVIQERLARLQRIEGARRQALAAALEQTLPSLPPAGEWVTHGGERVRVARVACGKLSHQGECTVVVEIAAAPAAPAAIECRKPWTVLFDAGGETLMPGSGEVVLDGNDQPCHGSAERVRVPIALTGGRPRLLQIVLGQGDSVLLLRVD